MIETRSLTSLGDLLRQETVQSMVHDMRAPMTVLKGYHQILLSGMVGQMAPEQRRLIELSVAPLEELILLTDNLLQMAVLDEGSISLNRSVVRIDELLEDVVRFYEAPFQQRHIALTRAAKDRKGFSLHVDSFWVKRLLHNLVWNAYKFTPDGGHVTLRAQADDDHLRLIVEDDGPGIARDKQATLFNKFTQCNPGQDKRFGAGLGLYICRRIMELHGGTITADSEPGRGCRFILSFPLA